LICPVHSASTPSFYFHIQVLSHGLFLLLSFYRLSKTRQRNTGGRMGAVVSNVYLSLTVVDEEERALEILTPWQGKGLACAAWDSVVVLWTVSAAFWPRCVCA
jgi:hypothetical protein